ncbi:diketogulonate reductase-like aldo/keto reductase [Endobacter medicaginis]|uniref:Aldo/keto reductase n=1 Tax=Endobacter medicaginis TaxID=1181271 RepID=A0A839V1G6_9PROT|nr:aldo/keto reductase [Endobacter medicaginis]MBB3174533.1 diketogulonate reductase-like aldo/keto reductase [Endobacter medicaginis]MCX5476451.1 aldo/keto reductase [Endobacter medicaginis]NVN29650.1 aldo/keto reductase [Endobacter medicaginis]
MPHVPSIALSQGGAIPQLGYGVWKISDDEAAHCVGLAIDAGYRSIDTAMIYRNETGVGRALAAAIDGGIRREDLFVTTKLWNDDQGYDSTLRAFDASLDRLGLDHVDLYLIHWPQARRGLYEETWKAFERIHAEGRAKAIGVSNFQIAHLDRLAETSGIIPALNQIELHPKLPQDELVAYHQAHSIVTEAWSPLAQGAVDDPVIGAIAARLDRSPGQVILRWHMQRGVVAIPKSATPSRIAQNIDIFDFGLSEDDMAAIAGLGTGERVGPDPDSF